MKKVRLGIVGIGNMGSSHARTVLDGKVKGMELAALCDVNAQKLAPFPGVKHFADSREMIRSGLIDAILIAVPHFDHTTIGIDALEQGLHVLVEKPISVHKADCERLIGAHKKEGQIFAAMFNQRTDLYYQKMRELIRGGELGQIRRVNWIITNWFRTEQYYASGDWRATWKGEGGGVLLNQCPHNLDLVWWLFGNPSKIRAFATLGRYHDIEVEDDVTAYFEYPDGAKLVFITSTGEAPGTNRLEVVGERGKLVYERDKLSYERNEVPMSEFSKKSEQGFATPSKWNVEIPVSGHGGQHTEIMENFAAAILEKKTLLSPAKEGIYSVEFANAMLLSSAEECTVDLPMDSGRYDKFLKKLIAGSRYQKKAAVGGSPVDLSSTYGNK